MSANTGCKRYRFIPWRRVLRMRDRGTAMVEFALIAPAFILLFAGVVDLGSAVYTRIRLESALEAGANYALLPANLSQVNSTNGAALANAIASLVVASSNSTVSTTNPAATVVVNNGPSMTVPEKGGTASAGGVVANADLLYCPTGSSPNWTWGAAVSSSATCTSGGQPGRFVAITVSITFNAFFPLYSFVQNGAMTAGTIVQTQ